MDVGLHVVSFSWPHAPADTGPTLGRIAEAAEQVGITDLSLMDHFFQLEMMGLTAEREMLEGYTTLGFLAAKTARVRLGLLVTGVTYRHPGLLAKMVTTLDVLSGGRAQLGIGAAWYEREHRGLGVPFPPLKERFERLEEALQICLQMWSDDNGPFEGTHYRLAETLNVPQSLQRPHPPILVGGMGEAKTLRLVARYADACNLFSGPGVGEIRHKLEVLRRHCDAEGRDYAAVRKTLLWVGPLPVGHAVDGFLSEMARYAGIGIDTVILMPGGGQPVADVRGLAPVVEPLRELPGPRR
jgi:F420-dependent oxidoreductase-like protein